MVFTFLDSGTQHWSHLGRPNPIESTSTVRLRTQRTKGAAHGFATLTMVFKLGYRSPEHWRRLNGSALLQKWSPASFIDGEECQEQVLKAVINEDAPSSHTRTFDNTRNYSVPLAQKRWNPLAKNQITNIAFLLEVEIR